MRGTYASVRIAASIFAEAKFLFLMACIFSEMVITGKVFPVLN
jgi:hypothetical protein